MCWVDWRIETWKWPKMIIIYIFLFIRSDGGWWLTWCCASIWMSYSHLELAIPSFWSFSLLCPPSTHLCVLGLYHFKLIYCKEKLSYLWYKRYGKTQQYSPHTPGPTLRYHWPDCRIMRGETNSKTEHWYHVEQLIS